MEKFSYSKYVNDKSALEKYNEYQTRYISEIRESDKVIISLVDGFLNERGDNNVSLLDIGCSTGNLLLHLSKVFPDIQMVGGDLALSSLEQCKKNNDLKHVNFRELDILDLPEDEFDVIIVNAVLFMFNDDQYDAAWKSLASCLKKDGVVILYDFAHQFIHQKITVHETTEFHPEGMTLSFRPMTIVGEHVARAGLSDLEFMPFEIPIDLEMPRHDEEVLTYTVTKDGGGRMMFRGALYQPWCHMVARKP